MYTSYRLLSPSTVQIETYKKLWILYVSNNNKQTNKKECQSMIGLTNDGTFGSANRAHMVILQHTIQYNCYKNLYILILHVFPSHPEIHVHAKSVPNGEHVPLFKHGDDLHGSPGVKTQHFSVNQTIYNSPF